MITGWKLAQNLVESSLPYLLWRLIWLWLLKIHFRRSWIDRGWHCFGTKRNGCTVIQFAKLYRLSELTKRQACFSPCNIYGGDCYFSSSIELYKNQNFCWGYILIMIQFLRSLPQHLLGIPARDCCHLLKQHHMRAHIPKRVPNLPTIDFFRLPKQPHTRAHIPKRGPNLLKSVKFMFST